AQFKSNVDTKSDSLGTPVENETRSLKAGRTIDWNADVEFTVDPSPKLFVDSNAALTVAERISVNSGLDQGKVVSTSAISVDNIVNTNSGNATFTVGTLAKQDGASAPQGELKGDQATFSRGSFYPKVEITNQSAKDLVINDISLGNPNAEPKVTLTADTVSLKFDIGSVDPSNELLISIDNQGAGNVQIAGLVDNPMGRIRVVNADGGIVSKTGSNGVLRGNVVEVDSDENVGTQQDDLKIDLVRSEGRTTDLDVTAGSDLWIDLTGRLRDTNTSQKQFDVGSIAATGDVNIDVQSALHETTPTGSGGAISVTANGGTAKKFYAKYDSDTATEPAVRDYRYFADTSKAAEIDAGFDFDQITGVNVDLEAVKPGESAARIDLVAKVNQADTGTLNVLTNGNVSLVETKGNAVVDVVQSTKGDITLTVSDGMVLDADVTNDSTTFVRGNSVSLTASKGVGTFPNPLEIDSSYQANGLVNVQASGDHVHLKEIAGDLRIGRVSTGSAYDLALSTVSGSMLAGNADEKADLQGRNIDLVVAGGSIGSNSNYLDFYGAGQGQKHNLSRIVDSVPQTGRLYATANADIYLQQVNAAANILKVESTAGDVSLKVVDTVLVNENFTGPYGEDLNLLGAGGNTLLGTEVKVPTVSAPQGNVTLRAGDGINLPAGSLVTADTDSGGQVRMQVDHDGVGGNDPDNNVGAVIAIHGNVEAETVVIEGGANLDFIQLFSGINANGETTLRGHGSDDRFFVQRIGGKTKLQGDAGADRYHIASNASKAVFTNNGVFKDATTSASDTFDPLDVLTGTLQHIKGVLTVAPGVGGNGGTLDVVNVGAAGNSSSLSGVVDASSVADHGALSGLGMSGRIEFAAPDDHAIDVRVGLGTANDSMQVKALPDDVGLYIQGRKGDDTLNVGNDANELDKISGVVVFDGGQGNNDKLNVRGNASVTAGQLTAVGVTGMQMGTNRLYGHHAAQGQIYDSSKSDPPAPGAVYYATRTTLNNKDTLSSTVEEVNVILGDAGDTFNIDSTYLGRTNITTSGGDDKVIIGSTTTGLYPHSTSRADFIHGTLTVKGESGTDSLELNDSGDDVANVGSFTGASVTGLGLVGTLAFQTIDKLSIRLGAQADTFYIPTTPSGVTTTVEMGGGFDTVYVGTTAGNEQTGKLDQIAGDVLIKGQGPEADDALYINDQGETSAQSFQIDNVQEVETITLQNGDKFPIDETTVLRSNAAGKIKYRTIERVVLSAGSANDQIAVHGTHREQAVEGKASTFSVNGGAGADTIKVGKPVNGKYSLADFQIDVSSDP
ncbi:MAG TPA: hypothetical protein DEF45_16445, partial [Rhodopirellula sp.]|nr:hypothetical protein [Rhodopirellula sp.]